MILLSRLDPHQAPDVVLLEGVIQRWRCPYCHAPAGVECVTHNGKACRPHQSRLTATNSVLGSQISLLRLKRDDPSFGLSAGDLLLAKPYVGDAGKWTILARYPDMSDPRCTQYRSAVTWAGWALAPGSTVPEASVKAGARLRTLAVSTPEDVEGMLVVSSPLGWAS